MYTEINFKTKAALKKAIKEGQQIRCFSPEPFPCPTEGSIYLEGPHYPKPHTWYANGELKNGVLVKAM